MKYKKYLVVVGIGFLVGVGGVFVGSRAYKHDLFAWTEGTKGWIVSGNYIYTANTTDNVGIGIITPTEKLHVDGKVKIGAYTLPSTDGGGTQVLKTDGAGTVSWGADATGGGGVGDRDIRFPDGWPGTVKNFRIRDADTYPVPAGKNLYILTVKNDGIAQDFCIGSWVYWKLAASEQVSFNCPLVVPGGSTIKGSAATSYYIYITGFEVDATVTVKNFRIRSTDTYPVTAGKNLYIFTVKNDNTEQDFYIGTWVYRKLAASEQVSFNCPLVVPGGSTIKGSAATSYYIYITGFEY